MFHDRRYYSFIDCKNDGDTSGRILIGHISELPSKEMGGRRRPPRGISRILLARLSHSWGRRRGRKSRIAMERDPAEHDEDAALPGICRVNSTVD